MRVAMITGSYPPQPCGVGDHAERLCRALADEGIDVNIITTRCEQRPPSAAIRYELDNWKLNNWRQAVEWLADQSYDLLHFQYPGRFYGYRPDLAFLTRTVRRRLPNLPIVITVHEFRVTHLLRKLTVACVVSSADAIILTTETERRVYARAIPWVRKKIHVINIAPPIPVQETSLNEREGVRRHYSIAEDEVLIAHFGFAQPNKGVERLLEAFALLRARHSKVRLLMMCLFEPDSNTYHARLQRQVESLKSRFPYPGRDRDKLEDAIIWTGFLSPEEVSFHFAAADLAVYPYTDGVSLRRSSFMTALCHGLPTVTTLGHTPLEELKLIDGENVLLIPAKAPVQTLADALSRLIASKELQLTLREGGLRWSQPLQWNNVAKKTIEVYRSALDRQDFARYD